MFNIFLVFTPKVIYVITTNQWLNPHKKMRKTPSFDIVYFINIFRQLRMQVTDSPIHSGL